MAKRKGRYTLVMGLLVDVCQQCGEVYLDAEALRQIDEAVASASETSEHMDVPVVRAVG